MEMTIKKRFGRVISANWQSWTGETELTKTIEVNSAEELQTESDKLFQQVKGLTENDMSGCEDLQKALAVEAEKERMEQAIKAEKLKLLQKRNQGDENVTD